MGKKAVDIYSQWSKSKVVLTFRKVCNSINKSEHFSPIICPNDPIILHKADFFFVCFRFFSYDQCYTIAHVTAKTAQSHGMINS